MNCVKLISNCFIRKQNSYKETKHTQTSNTSSELQNEYPSYQQTKKLELSGTMKARLVKIYDGDTQTYVVKFNDTFYNVVIRIHGIDTPELRSKNKVEIARAVHARNRVFEIITGITVGLDDKGADLNKKLESVPFYVTLICQGTDKYGRQLAIVNNWQGIDVGKQLLIERLALPYDGGKKPAFTQVESP